MFGQSWKVKKVVQYGTRQFAQNIGVDERTARRIGKGVGVAAGIGVAIKTLDFVGAKAMVIDEFVDNSIDESTSSFVSGSNNVQFGGDIPDEPQARAVGRKPTFG